MKFSIIIPVYKVEKYIAACLQSCLDQDIEEDEYEIILVDDGSPDKSMDIARQIIDKRPHVSIISQANSGLSAARNAGLKAACGEYVWFVDSDDKIAPNCLGYLKSLCEQYSPDIISFCAARCFDKDYVREFSRTEGECRPGKSFIIDGSIQRCSPFSLFRRDFLCANNLKFVEGIFHEDSEFTPRAYYLADNVLASDRVLYYATENPNSIMHTANPKKSYDSIQVVQANLSRFSLQADKSCRKAFNDLISSDFNHALKISYQINADQIKDLDKLAYDNRYLLKHLLGANKLKYKIAGLVYCIFPRHIVESYQFMHKIWR